MSSVDPLLADRVRKVTALLLAAVGTWLLLTFLSRVARGGATWRDPHLWGFLALALVAGLWVAMARRMRTGRTEDADREP